MKITNLKTLILTLVPFMCILFAARARTLRTPGTKAEEEHQLPLVNTNLLGNRRR
jgi:hypothetical protein